MNKRITPRVIKMLSLQIALIIVAVTAIGGAALVHNEFKATAQKPPVAEANKAEGKDGKNVPAKTGEKPTEPTKPVIKDFKYAYAGFNPRETTLSDDYSKIIVNGDYCLPKGYVPKLASAIDGSDVKLDSKVAPYYKAMYDDAKKDGITLTPVSGYRTIERQTNNFEAKIQSYIDEGMDRKEATIEAAKIIMIPGASEHNAGIAMDICSLADSFENTDEFAWLSEHAADYGFILRYPKDKTEITKVVYEPWHYRYVGIDAAKEITAKGITLEEYLGLV